MAITSKEQYHLVCSREVQLHLEVKGRVDVNAPPLGSQQLDEGLDFLWLNLLAPRDPQVPALPRTSQHLRGKRKRDFHSIKRYVNLTAWQMCRPLEVARCRGLMSPEPQPDLDGAR